MKSEWIDVKLENVVDLLLGFPFKSKEYSDNPKDYMLLRGDNIVQGKFRWENVKRWPKEKIIDKHQDYWLLNNDIVLAMDRPWISAGLKFAQITSSDLPSLLVQRVACLRTNDLMEQDYLRYVISSYNFVEYIKNVQTGTAVPHISGRQILDYNFRLPSKNIQLGISKILRTLDYKIELNRKMNQTLEEMAQTIFKSWFVDFDPVHARVKCGNDEELEAAAKELGIYKEVLELFPSKFKESELGMIPEGWKFTNIGESFEFLGGFAFKSSSYASDGEYGLVTIKNVQDGLFIEDCANYIADLPTKMKAHCLLQPGDVLLSLTGNVGRVCIVPNGQYVLNQRVSKIVSRNDIPKALSYFYFKLPSVFNSMVSIAKGTAQLNLSPIETTKLNMIVATDDILNYVSPTFDDLFDQILSNTNQIQTLQQTRDTLLPKLLSGELDVSELDLDVE